MADPENESPYNLDRRKNRVVQGVFSESAFQLSLVDRADPLSLSTFPMFGFHCVPHIGVYGAEFQPSLPFVLIHLPARLDLLRAQLPPTMEVQLRAQLPEEYDQGVDLYVIFHQFPGEELAHKQETVRSSGLQEVLSRSQLLEETRSINLMFHAWCFPDLPPVLEAVGHCELDVGVFDAHNLAPLQNVLEEEGDSLLPHQRAVLVPAAADGDGEAFLPHNQRKNAQMPDQQPLNQGQANPDNFQGQQIQQQNVDHHHMRRNNQHSEEEEAEEAAAAAANASARDDPELAMVTPLRSAVGPANLMAGAAFDRLAARQCVVHELNFSPCNLQVMLDSAIEPDLPCHSFFSVCRRRSPRPPHPRYAITFHVIPSSDESQSNLSQLVAQVKTPRELVQALRRDPSLGVIASQLRRFFLMEDS